MLREIKQPKNILHSESAEKILSPFEKEELRGIIELKFLLISI